MDLKAIQAQFDRRARPLEKTANWVSDRGLLKAHKAMLESSGRDISTMLELCCGTAMVTGHVKPAGVMAVGMDISSKMLQIARRKVSSCCRGNAEKIPFADNSFDAVVCRQAFQFLRPGKVLKEIKRVLKPGGLLLVSQHVPFGVEDQRWLWGIYRLLQPNGVFKRPGSLFLAEDLAGWISKAGFKAIQKRRYASRESISALLECYPNLSALEKRAIRERYLAAPAVIRKLYRFSYRKNDAECDWKWIIIMARSG